jgi:hypothetical protein
MEPNNESRLTKSGGPSPIQRYIAALATVAFILAAFGGFYLIAKNTSASQGASHGAAASSQPIPPQQVSLSATINGTALTQDAVTVPAGTLVTITVTADQTLDSFQIYDIGIFAHSPYPFSELTSCSTGISCSYSVSAEGKTETYTGFLQNVGGKLLASSSDISITWLPAHAKP